MLTATTWNTVTIQTGTPGPAGQSAVAPPPPHAGITAKLVLERVWEAGGELRLSDLDEAELAAWWRAAKVARLRLLRAGRHRLNRWSGDGTLRLVLDLVSDPDADDDDDAPLSPAEREALLRATQP